MIESMESRRPDVMAFPLPHVRDDQEYVETPLGWARVLRKTSHGSVIVSVFARREDPGPQEFPEWDAMRWADALLAEHRRTGYTQK